MIYRSSFGADRERSFLFSSLQEPEKLWRADRLTSALKKLTLDIAGLEFGVRAYRQLSIAVTERHLAHISSPFNRYDDKGADAKIEVAFAWQSGHRPLQRGTSYGIDAAFPDSLQPALLRVYKWASEEWHRFLDRSSDEPDIPKALTLEPGKRNQRSQAFRKRIRAGSPTTGTKNPTRTKRKTSAIRANHLDPSYHGAASAVYHRRSGYIAQSILMSPTISTTSTVDPQNVLATHRTHYPQSRKQYRP